MHPSVLFLSSLPCIAIHFSLSLSLSLYVSIHMYVHNIYMYIYIHTYICMYIIYIYIYIYTIHQRKPKSQPKMNIKCFSQHLSPHDKDVPLTAIWIPSTVFQERGQGCCGCCASSAILKRHPCLASQSSAPASWALTLPLAGYLCTSFLSHSTFIHTLVPTHLDTSLQAHLKFKYKVVQQCLFTENTLGIRYIVSVLCVLFNHHNNHKQ
jgi:Ca2+/Na+ antiporter